MYRTREVCLEGVTYLEILRKGKVWDSTHGQPLILTFEDTIGVLAAMPELKTYVESGGKEPPDWESRRGTRGADHLAPEHRQSVTIRRKSGFRANGKTVPCSYLWIECGTSSRGYGLMKAEALIALQKDLAAFVHKRLNPPWTILTIIEKKIQKGKTA